MTFAAQFEDEPAADQRGAVRRRLRLGTAGRLQSGADAEVTVHNISATGLLIESSAALTEGERFAVVLPEAGECSAEVVWTSAPMYGCRFAAPLSAAALSAAQLQGERPASPNENSEPFGERLHRLRLEKGLSLSDIAARLGVSKPTVWAWEHGKSRPVARRLSALAEALGVLPSGLEPPASSADQEIEHSRRRIAAAYGVEPVRVRIMIEL